MNTLGKNVNNKKSKRLKILTRALYSIGIAVVLIYLAFQFSPWPSVLVIRNVFHKGGSAANEKLAKYVPAGIASIMDIQYDVSNSKAKLDLYYPQDANVTNTTYPLITWVHGGAFVAGDKSELANYCKILASKGFVVAAINYSRAPSVRYPVPVIETNKAIAFLIKNAGKLHISDAQFIIAGDSGGAHIAAQIANIFTNPAYAGMLGITPPADAGKLGGAILYCGPYNISLVNFEGESSWFLKSVLWAYTGHKGFKDATSPKSFSVADFITGNFPKTFISVGNKDPLSPHSHDLASKLVLKGVQVDSLFFADNYTPGLPHEYQFDLDTDAGKLALERTTKFLSICFGKPIN